MPPSHPASHTIEHFREKTSCNFTALALSPLDSFSPNRFSIGLLEDWQVTIVQFYWVSFVAQVLLRYHCIVQMVRFLRDHDTQRSSILVTCFCRWHSAPKGSLPVMQNGMDSILEASSLSWMTVPWSFGQ